MDLKTFLQNLHEEVSCSVCMSTFTDPKILPCFHTFCLHCLNELQRTSGLRGELTCPECRRKFQVPGSGYPKELPTNFRMNSLLDVMAIKECNIRGLSVETAKKQALRVFIVFNVVPSGAKIALQLTTLFEQIRTTECWRLKILKIKTLKTC